LTLTIIVSGEFAAGAFAMKCRDFHSEWLATPNELSEAACAHAGQCTRCAEFAQSVRNFDRRLIEAMCVSAPEFVSCKDFMEILAHEA
jgi:hypothetical protein